MERRGFGEQVSAETVRRPTAAGRRWWRSQRRTPPGVRFCSQRRHAPSRYYALLRYLGLAHRAPHASSTDAQLRFIPGNALLSLLAAPTMPSRKILTDILSHRLHRIMAARLLYASQQ